MCGRYTLMVPDAGDVAEALGASIAPEIAAAYRPRFNVAPTDPQILARLSKEGKREIIAAAWGFLPHWAKDAKGAAKAINARSETVRTTPMFRDAFVKGRCLVPADGFYEWTGAKKERRPLWFHPPQGGLLAFAGLYGSWVDPIKGERVRTFTILTTAANDVVSAAHDRMPVLLAPEDRAAWLEGSPEEAYALLKPAPHEALEARAVSKKVNAVANDDPSLLEADAPEETPVGATLKLFG